VLGKPDKERQKANKERQNYKNFKLEERENTKGKGKETT